MNMFNRLAMALLAAVLLGLAVGAALVLVGAVLPGQLFPGRLAEDALASLADLRGWQHTVALLVVLLVAVGALVLLVLEILPRRRRREPFLVADGGRGTLTVEREGVCRLAEKVATDIHGILAARVTASEAAGEEAGVSFRCRLDVSADAVVTELGGKVQDTIRDSVETQVGLAVREVTLRVRIRTERPSEPPPRTVE